MILRYQNEIIDQWKYEKSEVKKGKILTREYEIDCDKKGEIGEKDPAKLPSLPEKIETDSDEDSDDTVVSRPEISTEVTDNVVFPEELEYADSDGDGYIDRLFLYYSHTLTGSLDLSAFRLDSATGGLDYSAREMLTGQVLSGSIVESAIVLDIVPATIKKSFLSIDNTDSSELRIFSDDDLGIKSPEGYEIRSLDLEAFGDYSTITHPYDDSEDADENFDFFPKIIPVLQRPTNAIFSGANFVCVENPCHINVDFSTIFSEKFPKNHFGCEISVKNSKNSGENVIKTCNP